MLRKRVAYRRKTDLQICTVDVNRVSVNQDTRELTSDCFSLDLQQIRILLKVLYRIPDPLEMKAPAQPRASR